MVRVYTGKGCVPCHTLKNYLQKLNIDYSEHERGSPEYQEMYDNYKIATVPVTLVDDEVIVGPQIGKILATIKNKKDCESCSPVLSPAT